MPQGRDKHPVPVRHSEHEIALCWKRRTTGPPERRYYHWPESTAVIRPSQQSSGGFHAALTLDARSRNTLAGLRPSILAPLPHEPESNYSENQPAQLHPEKAHPPAKK